MKRYLFVVYWIGIDLKIERSYRCSEDEIDSEIVNFEFAYNTFYEDVLNNMNHYKSIGLIVMDTKTNVVYCRKTESLEALKKEMESVLV